MKDEVILTILMIVLKDNYINIKIIKNKINFKIYLKI